MLSTLTVRKDYTGTGSLKTFSYDFLVFAETDLLVYVGGTLKTYGTDYSITGIGVPAGGTVIFAIAPGDGVAVLLIRVIAFTQLVNYISHDAFPAETHETALDRLTMMAQQASEAMGRCPKVPVTSLVTNLALPVEANKYFRWNAAGTALELKSLAEMEPLEIPVPIIKGGTGGTTPAEARENLGIPDEVVAHKTQHQNGGDDEISVAGLSGLLADGQTPLAHKTSHESGGSDAIKLDDLSIPDDNTDLNVSITKHGLCPKAPNDTSLFLRGDGAFAVIPGAGAFQKCRSYRSTARGVVAGWYLVEIDADSFDPSNISDLTSGHYWIKPTSAGYYLVTAQVALAGLAGSYVMPGLYKNGSVVSYGTSIQMAGTNIRIGVVSDMLYFDGVNDYVQLYTYTDTDSALSIGPQNNYIVVVGSF